MNIVQIEGITIIDLAALLGNIIDEKLSEKLSDHKPQIPVDNDKYLTRHEAISISRLSNTALYRRVQDGTIRCHRIGRRILFKKSELLEDLNK